MKITQLKEEESKLLNRKDGIYEIEFDKSTPSNDQVKKAIAEFKKVDENLLVITRVRQIFGIKKAKVVVKLYNSQEDLKKVEVRNKKQKKKEEKKEEKK